MFMVVTMENLTERALAYLFFNLVSVVNVILRVGDILVFISIKAEIVLGWSGTGRKRLFLFSRNIYVIDCLIV